MHSPPASILTLRETPVPIYTLTNNHGLKLKVSSYGTIITEFYVPDRQGNFADIVLGYESIDEYRKATPYFGATVGRVANRIRDARFELAGKVYELAANNGPHNLHGGTRGWDKVTWEAHPADGPKGRGIRFVYNSRDGEEGFPGNVTASVSYTLTERDELIVEMEATTDQMTLVNMAHHTYWNLAGHDAGTIRDHELQLMASNYTPSAEVKGADPVPDGTVAPVSGTPFDFRNAKPVGRDLAAVGGNPVGFDDNWIVDGNPNELRQVARVRDPSSGRVMTLEANQPGVQFYSGKFLDGSNQGKGATYEQYAGFCLETQKFPNAINVPAWREQVILRPGQAYRHIMVHRFTTE